MLTTILLAASLTNMWPQSYDEALQQSLDASKEGYRTTDKYLEEHRQEDQIKALHDIEDAIIFDSLERGDD